MFLFFCYVLVECVGVYHGFVGELFDCYFFGWLELFGGCIVFRGGLRFDLLDVLEGYCYSYEHGCHIEPWFDFIPEVYDRCGGLLLVGGGVGYLAHDVVCELVEVASGDFEGVVSAGDFFYFLFVVGHGV